MDIEVSRPECGWTERALSFMPGTVVQFLSSAGRTIRARCAGETWVVLQCSAGTPMTPMTVGALLLNLGDAPRLRVIASA